MSAPPAAGCPAGIARRYAAWSLDFVVVAAASLLLTWSRLRLAAQALAEATASLTAQLGRHMGDLLLQGGDPAQLAPVLMRDPGILAAAGAVQSALFALCLPPLLAYAALGLAWHVGFQRGQWQASPGERALGLVVVRADGTRVPPLQLAWRHLASALSWLTLNLGHALALLPPHRALHDLLSGTAVFDHSGEPRLPGWAKAWLASQSLLLCAALAWGLLHYLALLRAALA